MELLIGRDSHAERHFALPSGETLIGRRPDCRIVLDAPAIGPRHARVFSVNGRAVLYAISPEWPVYVNGDAVERRVLAHDDDIQLAHYR
ncbi:MAG: FHA domain-containing protein, partial [Arenicellales bacterium]